MAGRSFDEGDIVAALRSAGARFAFVHGSRAGGTPAADADLDLAAWWGSSEPDPWAVALPPGVDLLVLDSAPLERRASQRSMSPRMK